MLHFSTIFSSQRAPPTYSKLVSLGCIVVASVATLGIDSPAFATDSPVVVSAPSTMVVRSVSYADLNLAFSPGERTLNRRVSGAVDSFCSETIGAYDGSFRSSLAMRQCHDSAWDQARPQIAQAVNSARDLALVRFGPVSAAAEPITVSK